MKTEEKYPGDFPEFFEQFKDEETFVIVVFILYSITS